MKSLRAIYSVYCILVFVLFFFIFFPFFLVLSLLGRTGEKGIWFLIKLWAIIWFTLIGQRTQIIGWDKSYKKDIPMVCVANHQSYLDTAMIFRAMPFMAAPLAKYELVKIPLFGFLYRKMAILIDRTSVASRRVGYQKLYKMLQNTQRSVFIFPEGTFEDISEQNFLPFYDGAFKIAIETQRPLLPVLFLDTKDRFNDQKFWEWSPGITRALFLPPVVPPKSINELESFKQTIKTQMEDAFKKYKHNI